MRIDDPQVRDDAIEAVKDAIDNVRHMSIYERPRGLIHSRALCLRWEKVLTVVLAELEGGE